MNTLTIETTISAPVQTVWEFWTQPEHIMQWNAASDDWQTTEAANDVRVGGKFTSRMEAKDKSMGFDFGGSYTNVALHELLEYTLDDGRKVSVHFTEKNNGVLVTQSFEPETENPPEMQKQGWQAILNNFKHYCEASK